MRTFSPAATLEAGYLWEHSAMPDPLSRDEHVLLTTFTLQFPR